MAVEGELAEVGPAKEQSNSGGEEDKTASSVLGHLSIGTRSVLLLGHPLVGMSFKGASNGPGRGELPAGGSAEESSGSES